MTYRDWMDFLQWKGPDAAQNIPYRAEKKLPNHDESINIFLASLIWLGIFYKIGRARRGVSGTLYSQSAIARLNSFPRVDRIEPLLP